MYAPETKRRDDEDALEDWFDIADTVGLGRMNGRRGRSRFRGHERPERVRALHARRRHVDRPRTARDRGNPECGSG
jgi:hypothetical protein